MAHYRLPPLPYGYDALEPWVSAETLRLHHDVLQRRYVDTLNELVGDRDVSLESIIVNASPGRMLDNAMQVWNHTFLWSSMSPTGGGWPPPRSDVGTALSRWDPEDFVRKFVDCAAWVFGSGYIWIVADPAGEIRILSARNAGNPLRDLPEYRPLLTLDVWEHAYLLDYGADRKRYAQIFLQHLANWDFAEANFRGHR